MMRQEVHLSRFYIGVMIFVGLMTCGIGALIMWRIASTQFPSVIDSQGIKLRNGDYLLWKDLTAKKRITVVTKTGQRMAGGLDLYFGKKKVKIAPQSFAEGHAVLDTLRKILGDNVDIG
jgi:hypothetical protein